MLYYIVMYCIVLFCIVESNQKYVKKMIATIVKPCKLYNGRDGCLLPK